MWKGWAVHRLNPDFSALKKSVWVGAWKETSLLFTPHMHIMVREGVGSLVLDVKHIVRLLWLVWNLIVYTSASHPSFIQLLFSSLLQDGRGSHVMWLFCLLAPRLSRWPCDFWEELRPSPGWGAGGGPLPRSISPFRLHAGGKPALDSYCPPPPPLLLLVQLTDSSLVHCRK